MDKLTNTATAAGWLGISRQTFAKLMRKNAQAPTIKPGDAAHYWTDEQIKIAQNPPAMCETCGSPYHTTCWRTYAKKNRGVVR